MSTGNINLQKVEINLVPFHQSGYSVKIDGMEIHHFRGIKIEQNLDNDIPIVQIEFLAEVKGIIESITESKNLSGELKAEQGKNESRRKEK